VAVVVHRDFNVVVSVLGVHTELNRAGEICRHSKGLE
jgi:hypothetical protein